VLEVKRKMLRLLKRLINWLFGARRPTVPFMVFFRYGSKMYYVEYNGKSWSRPKEMKQSDSLS